jgi:hypothetical protein
MKEIKLTQGFSTIVDDDDFEFLNKFKWHLAKTKMKKIAIRYIITDINKRKTIFMHRVIANIPHGKFVDHIDHNGLNNQKSNLRIYSQQKENEIKHGDSKKRIYREWHNMVTRTTVKHSNNYYRYGGRGITICNEWLNYLTFKEWAINNGYSDDLTIDRTDNTKGYYPENCRWITAKENSLNKTYGENVGILKRGNRWQSVITRDYVNYYLGLFKTIEEAREARKLFLTNGIYKIKL